MPYSISTRELEPGECEALRSSLRFSSRTWQWILLPLLVWGLFGALLGLCLEGLLSFAGADVFPYLLSALSAVGLAWGCCRAAMRFQDKVRRELERSVAQVVHVWDAPCIELQDDYGEDFCYFFQVAPDKILLLVWNWEFSTVVFGPNDVSTANLIEEANNRISARPFPSSEFKIHRTPNCRRRLRIEALGQAIEPVVSWEEKDLRMPSCGRGWEMIVGSLDDLPAAVERFDRIAEFDLQGH